MKLNVITIILCTALIITVDLSIHNVRAQQMPLSHENNSAVVTTQELRLVDKKGRLRAVFDGSGIVLKDDFGNNRVQIGFPGGNLNDDPEIDLLDRKGHSLASMQLFLGSPEVNLTDENGNPSASLEVLVGEPILRLSSQRNKLAPAGSGDMQLSALASGPHIEFCDTKNHALMDFSASELDIPRIKAYDQSYKLVWQNP